MGISSAFWNAGGYTLAEVSDETLDSAPAAYAFGSSFQVDMMLEHAVMHPIRHEFQLKRAYAKASSVKL